MSELIKNRTIRPSTRLSTSKSYKIDTSQVLFGDTLIVNIFHENKTFKKTYKFDGADVALKNSISFRVNDFGNSIDISWSGVQPYSTTGSESAQVKVKNLTKPKVKKTIKVLRQLDLKQSFEPISNSETRVLILGTLPGEKSLLLKEYYGHPRNKFWKIISAITKNELPSTYPEKQALLLKTKIGIWDVAHSAIRNGSLDNAINNEKPNDLESFISNHKNLRVIGFNGEKSEKLFDKYFKRKKK